MIYLLGSGASGFEWFVPVVLLSMLGVVVLIGYLIAGAAGMVKKKRAPEPPKGRAVFLALVTLFLGAVLIRNVSSREHRVDDYTTFLITLIAPIVVAAGVVFVFKNKKG
jgi:hypothetical protein